MGRVSKPSKLLHAQPLFESTCMLASCFRFGPPGPAAAAAATAAHAHPPQAVLPKAPLAWTDPLRIDGDGPTKRQVFCCCACFHEYECADSGTGCVVNECEGCNRPLHPECGIDQGTDMRDRRSEHGICDSCHVKGGKPALLAHPVRLNKIVPVHLRPKDTSGDSHDREVAARDVGVAARGGEVAARDEVVAARDGEVAARAEVAAAATVASPVGGKESFYSVCQAFVHNEAVLPLPLVKRVVLPVTDVVNIFCDAIDQLKTRPPLCLSNTTAADPSPARRSGIVFNVGHDVHHYAASDDDLSGSDIDMVRAEDYAEPHVIDLTL